MKGYRLTASELTTLIKASIIPEEVLLSPAHVSTDEDGIVLTPALDAGRDVLISQGVVEEEHRSSPTHLCCWAAALPVIRASLPDVLHTVLFVVPSDRLLHLGRELLRLGCDRQRWRRVHEDVLLIAHQPPWYSVFSALESGSLREVFTERSPGVWVELAHRLPVELPASPDGLLLVRASSRWSYLPDGEWSDLYQQISLPTPNILAHTPAEALPKLPVTLHLVDSGFQDTASLWVAPVAEQPQIERWIERLPDLVVDQLLFAVTESSLIFRARPSRAGPPEITLRAPAFSPLPDLPHIFCPVGTQLEPPLRAHRLRALLAPERDEIAWLSPTAATFVVHRLEESAFRPLSDWIEYIIASEQQEIQAWIDSTVFQFERWTDRRGAWAEPRSSTPEKQRETVPVSRPSQAPPSSPQAVASPPLATRRQPQAVQISHQDAVAELQELELSFFTTQADKAQLWSRMAQLHQRLAQPEEASLCWVHAVWTTHGEERAQLTSQWSTAMQQLLSMAPTTLREHAESTPSSLILTALASAILAEDLPLDPTLRPLFENQKLNVRTSWLVQAALAKGDPLALAQAKDSVLNQLRDGLSFELDTPRFLRANHADVVDQTRAQLRSIHDFFTSTKRTRSVIEARPELTEAYLSLIFAWGSAATGERLHTVNQELDHTDPVHNALVSAYTARIQQASQRIPREAPLPQSVVQLFDRLPTLARYKADRLRQASGILETHSIDPFTNFRLQYENPYGPEFNALHRQQPGELCVTLRTRLDALSGHPEPARILQGSLAAMLHLPERDAVPFFLLIVSHLRELPPPEQIRPLGHAIVNASLLGLSDLASDLATLLQEDVRTLPPEHLSVAAECVAKSVRSLGRVGIKEQAQELLSALHLRAETSNDVRLQLVIARGLASFGDHEAATPLINVGLEALRGELLLAQRLSLARSVALALSVSPLSSATPRLIELASMLPMITDSYNTNSHFCLSVLHLAESIVLGFADRHLHISETTRRWMDTAEHEIRQQVFGYSGSISA